MVYDIKVKVVLVTGGANGIGAGSVRTFVEEGAKLDDYYSRTGVRVLTVCFGVTDTALYDNLGSFDKDLQRRIPDLVKEYPSQKTETAAKALVDVFKQGENGSVWLSTSEKPVKDVTNVVHKAYALLTELVFE